MPTLQINKYFAKRYLLKKLIGIGGYSQVWLVEDIKANNLEVALKIFAPEKGLDAKGLEVFSKEYSLVFNLNHKNLLIPKHFDEFDNSPYLVLHYCRQGSVFGKIGEVSELELACFMQQAASALSYLHSQDPPLIHQDIKPDNFLIGNQDNYLLSDFGISSKVRRTLTKSMGAQASTGTLAYMPPEKFSADKQIIKAGDIFSLGVTMYELLTGDLPFGDNGGLTLKAGADVPNLPKNFDPELNGLLKRCMAKDPWERPTAEKLEETAGNFLTTRKWQTDSKDTQNSVHESSQKPEQPREGRKTEPIPHIQPEAPSHAESQHGSLKRENHYLWIIGVALVVIVTAAITILWTKGPTAKQIEETRIADSIRVADSLAMVQAELQRIADSIAYVQQNTTTDWVEQHPNNEHNTTSVQNSRLKLGDHNSGGIIFYLDQTGEHGKVCAAEDQNSNSNWIDANTSCNYSNLNGYNDWYLPTQDDLERMYQKLHKNGIGAFATTYYWSSSEYNSANVWIQSFNSGSQFVSSKSKIYHVRAVRTF